MLKITIVGPAGSGKSWCAMLIRAAISEITGADVTMLGETMAEHAVAQRQFQLMAGAIKQPLRGQEVLVEQVCLERRPSAEAKAAGPTLETQARALADKLVELERYLPPGPRRDAFARAYKAINETIDQLEKARAL